jgi:uncharacterized membrane protein YccF (DUF307 family)
MAGARPRHHGAIILIGFPLAWPHLKLAPISLWPIGKMIVNREEAARLQRGRGA